MSVFVFDADDTLWMNEGQYSAACAKFFAYLYEALDYKVPNLHYLKERYFAIDKELFPEWGIRRGRVAETMLRTYREVCRWAEWKFGVNPHSAKHEHHIRKIGDLPFDYTQLQWLAGACDVLTALRDGGNTLCLLTSYDPAVFPARRTFLNLGEFFAPERMRAIPGRKTKDDFLAVTDGLGGPPTSCYAVGNGESDIKPALELGDRWRGIYIPHGSTSAWFQPEPGQDSPVPPEFACFMPPAFVHPRVTTIYRIEDLPSAL